MVKIKENKGFTLIELIISLALISLIIVTATQLAVFGIKGHNLTVSEFEIQSNFRVASQQINNTIRNSSGVFLLHRENANDLTKEWNYIMLSPQKDRMLHYLWNASTKTHDVQEIFPAINGIQLSFELTPGDASNPSKLLGVQFSVLGLGETRSLDTILEAKNALQVVDRSYSNKANTLAYRGDTRLDDVANSQAVVTMVLDKSGSMGDRMNGSSWWLNDKSNDPIYNSRMKLMKNKATGLVEDLAKYPNVYIGVIPFDSRAYNPDPYQMLNAQNNLVGLKETIAGLVASGGTNTGDGIRRAYHSIRIFNEKNPAKTNKNFMIILVDGVTTIASVHEVIVGDTISFNSNQGPIVIRPNEKKYYYSYMENNFFSSTYYYKYNRGTTYVTGDKNINETEKAVANTEYVNGRYYGNGSLLDPYGTEYVNLVGGMVQSYKEGTNEEIKVYVIGFSGVKDDFESLKDIAKATTGKTDYYEAGSSEALEEIFRAIQRDISDALWHIGGPN